MSGCSILTGIDAGWIHHFRDQLLPIWLNRGLAASQVAGGWGAHPFSREALLVRCQGQGHVRLEESVGWPFFAVKSDELHSPYFCGWRLPALKICELQNIRIFGFWPIAIDSICFYFRDSMSMDDHSPYEFPCPWYPVISLDVFHCKRPAQVATLTLLLVLWWLFSSLYYHHYNMTTLYYNVYICIYIVLYHSFGCDITRCHGVSWDIPWNSCISTKYRNMLIHQNWPIIPVLSRWCSIFAICM